MKKRIIFDNWDVSIDDYAEYFEELQQDENRQFTETEKWDLFYEELETNYEDEKSNLDVYLDNNIVAIADLGLWNGRRSGYNILNNNLNSILNGFNCDYMQVYQDRHNVRSKCIHHDGTNYILFRMLRPGLSFSQIDNFQEKLCTGTLSARDLRRYTVSLNKFIDNIYGKCCWKGEN